MRFPLALLLLALAPISSAATDQDHSICFIRVLSCNDEDLGGV